MRDGEPVERRREPLHLHFDVPDDEPLPAHEDPVAADDEPEGVRPEVVKRSGQVNGSCFAQLDDRENEERAGRRKHAPHARAPVDEMGGMLDQRQARPRPTSCRAPRRCVHATRTLRPPPLRRSHAIAPGTPPTELGPEVTDRGNERQVHRRRDDDENAQEARHASAPMRCEGSGVVLGVARGGGRRGRHQYRFTAHCLLYFSALRKPPLEDRPVVAHRADDAGRGPDSHDRRRDPDVAAHPHPCSAGPAKEPSLRGPCGAAPSSATVSERRSRVVLNGFEMSLEARRDGERVSPDADRHGAPVLGGFDRREVAAAHRADVLGDPHFEPYERSPIAARDGEGFPREDG